MRLDLGHDGQVRSGTGVGGRTLRGGGEEGGGGGY